MSDDRWTELFRLQRTLDDAIFASRGLRTRQGSLLTHEALRESLGRDQATGATDSGMWMRRLVHALKEECTELENEIPWKWWSTREADLGRVHEELIDILHFWLSLAQISGLDPDSAWEIYRRKREVNFRRLEDGYRDQGS